MRRDMQKVIVERPRRNSGDGAGDLKGDSRRRYKLTGKLNRGWTGGGTKEFNDLTNPLKGYLRKQIGRPWNDIWSDVCRSGDNRDVVHKHLRQHVRGYVSINNYRNGLPAYADFYVDAKGILQRTPDRWPRSRASQVRVPWRHLTETTQIQLIDGIWYLLTVEKIPPISVPHYNYAMKRTEPRLEIPGEYAARDKYGRAVQVIAKRQLGKHDMKMYGVKTGVPITK